MDEKKIQVRFPLDVWEVLKTLARQHERSFNGEVNWALREYRYTGRPLQALKGLDPGGCVIYLGTLSKVLFPSLRLGYIVVPPALINAFITARRVFDVHPPLFEQLAVARYMSEGHFARHIRRMRLRYAERGEYLRHYARKYLGDLLTIDPPVAGLHLVGWFRDDSKDTEMARVAMPHGIDVSPISSHRIEEDGLQGVLLGYASFTEREIVEGIQHLARAWLHDLDPGCPRVHAGEEWIVL